MKAKENLIAATCGIKTNFPKQHNKYYSNYIVIRVIKVQMPHKSFLWFVCIESKENAWKKNHTKH